MSMEMTWLEFQLLTDNQNSRHLAIKIIIFYFFFRLSSKPGIYIDFRGLRVYWHLSVFVCDWKRGYGGHLDFLI